MILSCAVCGYNNHTKLHCRFANIRIISAKSECVEKNDLDFKNIVLRHLVTDVGSDM